MHCFNRLDPVLISSGGRVLVLPTNVYPCSTLRSHKWHPRYPQTRNRLNSCHRMTRRKKIAVLF